MNRVASGLHCVAVRRPYFFLNSAASRASSASNFLRASCCAAVSPPVPDFELDLVVLVFFFAWPVRVLLARGALARDSSCASPSRARRRPRRGRPVRRGASVRPVPASSRFSEASSLALRALDCASARPAPGATSAASPPPSPPPPPPPPPLPQPASSAAASRQASGALQRRPRSRSSSRERSSARRARRCADRFLGRRAGRCPLLDGARLFGVVVVVVFGVVVGGFRLRLGFGFAFAPWPLLPFSFFLTAFSASFSRFLARALALASSRPGRSLRLLLRVCPIRSATALRGSWPLQRLLPCSAPLLRWPPASSPSGPSLFHFRLGAARSRSSATGAADRQKRGDRDRQCPTAVASDCIRSLVRVAQGARAIRTGPCEKGSREHLMRRRLARPLSARSASPTCSAMSPLEDGHREALRRS